MTGTLVNIGAVIIGSIIGLVFKKALTEKYQAIHFQAVGLLTLLLGFNISFGISALLLVVISLGPGGSEAIKLEDRVEQLDGWIKTKINYFAQF